MPLPKRFYKTVEFHALTKNPEDHFEILLDDRKILTPKKNILRVRSRQIATLVVEEWKSQSDYIDPALMPITRLLNSAIDVVGENRGIILDDIIKFAASDLLLYRAESPEGLVELQSKIWEPILGISEEELGHQFVRVKGINYLEQPSTPLQFLRENLSVKPDCSLAAIHLITTLTGSALLAFLISRGKISEEQAWLAAHLDEDWQNTQWGIDSEAHTRRQNQKKDFQAASLILQN